MKPFLLRKAYSILARFSLLWILVLAGGRLQAALQDNWAVDHAFEYGGETPMRTYPWIGGYTDSEGNVYAFTSDVSDEVSGSNVTMYDINGVLVRQLNWTAQKQFAVGNDDSLMLWDNTSPMVITTKNIEGAEIGLLETGIMTKNRSYMGDLPFERLFARDVNGDTYVADTSNSVVKVFNSSGALVRTIGEKGSGSWQLDEIHYIAVGRCDLVAIFNKGSSYVDTYIKLYRKDGTYLNRIIVYGGATQMPIAVTDDGLVVARAGGGGQYVGAIYNVEGALVSSFGPRSGYSVDGGIAQAFGLICNPINGNMYTFDVKSRKMLAWRRAYRTFGAHPARLVPLPGIHSVVQRVNGWIDIDYIVNDGDSATVQTALAAYKNGTGLLKDLVPIASANLIDGTGPQLGSNIATGTVKRLTWNPSGAGLPTGNLTFEVFAKDDRPGLLDVDYIKLPGTTTLISRSPLTHADMRAAWAWLLATGNASLSRDANGEITGPGGTFSTTVGGESRTTAAGRAWLFAQLGAREATTPELTQARKATASSTPNQFDLDYKQQIGGRPTKTNEWTFDSYSGYGSEVWWLVKLP